VEFCLRRTDLMANRRVNGYGVVKAVLSGDTFVLMGAPKERGQIPPERVIVLSGINAPRFARGKNSVDEPYAWESREFCRKKAIGQQVSFHVQHTFGERDYGAIFVGDENMGQSLLKAGFASLKELPEGAKPTVEREGLMVFETEAKAAGLGMWSKSEDPASHVRNIDWAPPADKLYDRYLNKPVPAVVSQLRNGSALRCEVAGSFSGKSGNPFMIVTLSLAGASCARVPFSDKSKEDAKEPEPFALEANHWVEARLLNRDVQIVIRGIDKTDNVYGDILFPKGDVTTKLLELGLATYVPWTASMSPNATALATAAEVAKVGKIRLGATAPDEVKPEEMIGHVTYVQSGDTVLFVNDADNSEQKFSIASIRTQRPPRRGEEASPASAFAWDAKEFLRQRLVGSKNKVRVVVEYTRTVGSDTDRKFGSLWLKDVNLGVGLVQAGFAEVVRHKWDDPHSLSYGDLIAAERTAVKTSAGQWGKKGGSQITDLTDRPRRGEPGEEVKMQTLAAKGASYMLGLKKKKVVSAVVEYCFTGGRFKLYIPDEKIIVAFNLSGVRSPNAKEPFGSEALEFSRSLILQKSVRVELETCDRGCNFIGHMFVSNENLAVKLLDAGFSSVFGPAADRSPYCDELYTAEDKAKEAKLNIWKNYVEKVADPNDEDEGKITGGREGAVMEVTITEITDAATFYINRSEDPNVAKVAEVMAKFNESPPPAGEVDTRKGAIVAGLFSDELWYRVRLEGMTSSGEWRVQFLDFGNSDLLPTENLRELPAEAASLAGTAKPCFLAGLRAPSSNSEHFGGAAETFHHLAFDRTLSAKIECIDKDKKMHLSLTPRTEDVEEGDTKTSINQIMLREGWCRLIERPEYKLKDYVNNLKSEESSAKLARYNIWEYGDVSDEEEDGVDPAKARFDGRVPARQK